MTKTDAVDHTRKPGWGSNPSKEEMLSRVAFYKKIPVDGEAFPDLEHDDHARSVKYVISKDKLAGPAPIDAPHNFHMANMKMPKGVKPVVHAHPYNEVFMPLNARFKFFWGNDAGDNEENSVILEPMDVISVPAGVHRTFENLDDHPGNVLVLFDIADDPHTNMVVPPDVYEEFYADGWVPGQAPKK